MTTLFDMQTKFARKVGELILKAYEMGYEVTFGDAFRDPRVFGYAGQDKGYGHKNSYHKARLAIDLNLFKHGKYLQTTEDHRPLGEWWESQGPEFSWGGDWNDGNHYSLGETRK